MVEESNTGNNWTGGGLDARSGCGGLGLIGGVAVVLLACLVGLVVVSSIEDSRANRAQAKASAENARAAARAAEARAEVDKEAIRADSALALQAERHEHDLAVMRQSEAEFRRNYTLALLAVSHLDEQELRQLEAQLDATEGQSRTPLWWSCVAGCLAALVFLAGLYYFYWLPGKAGRR